MKQPYRFGELNENHPYEFDRELGGCRCGLAESNSIHTGKMNPIGSTAANGEVNFRLGPKARGVQ